MSDMARSFCAERSEVAESIDSPDVWIHGSCDYAQDDYAQDDYAQDDYAQSDGEE